MNNAFRRIRLKPDWLVFVLSFTFLLALEGTMRQYAIDGVYFQRWTSEDMMQTVSIADLREAPLESLFYLHIQPPLLDLIRASLTQLWPRIDERALLIKVDRGLYFIWCVLYAGMMALLFRWLKQTTSVKIASVATLVFAIHPAAILYATFLENTFLLSFGILWSYYELWRLFKAPGEHPIWRLSASFTLLFMTRSVFQWPTILVFVVALFLIRIPTRKIMLFLAICGSVVGIYTAKQYVLFGITYSSSLAAGNCMHGLGDFSDYAGWGVSEVTIPPPVAQVAVLTRKFKFNGAENFNHYKHLAYHKVVFPLCVQRLRTQPWSETAKAWLGNVLIYLQPTSQFTTPHVIADRLPWRDLYNLVFSGVLLLVWFFVLSFTWLRENGRTKLWEGIGMLLPAGYIFLASVLFERGENMRYKFFLEPVLYVFIVTQFSRLHQDFRRSRSSPSPSKTVS